MIKIKNDIYFIITATLIWIFGLIYSLFDFIYLKKDSLFINTKFIFFLFIIILGISIRLHCRKKLKGGFTYMLQTKNDQQLVTDGIYSIIRHPSYIADYSIQLSFTLILGSEIGFIIMTLLIFPFVYRIKIEEQMLVDKFGPEYVQYQKQTKKLIPFIF